MTEEQEQAGGKSAEEGDSAGSRDGKSFWQRLGPVVVIAAIAIAAFLLYRTLSRYDFDELVASVTSIPASRLMMAIGWAAASYLCLTGFDWLALRYVGRPLSYPRTALASFVSLSIGHNLGFAALSSGAIRYRFYSRAGLTAEEVGKLIVFCGVTVGLGLATLAGIALLARPDLAEAIAGLSPSVVPVIAAGCLAVPVIYLGLALTVRRPLRFGSFSIEVPGIKLAAGQLVIGVLNFACVAACLHQTVSAVAEVPYFAVAAVYVTANVATLITHVPGGLGVIESVVLLLLKQSGLIGSVLVFRFVYFLLPLCLGGTLFALTELKLGFGRLAFGSSEREGKASRP